MDNLNYYYNGNQLHSITDTSAYTTGFNDGNSSDNIYDNGNDDYKYDANGNIILDKNSGITSILYNHLNLPTTVYFNGSTINYTYDANGVKLRKVFNGITTDYDKNHIYVNNNLKYFNHTEGYFEVTSTSGLVGGNYIYQYKDHIDNIRLSFKKSGSNVVIVSEKNYYPFGLTHLGYNNTSLSSNIAEKKGFTSKELQDELAGGKNLNWYDFGARNYNASIGRWMNIDPLAEKYSPITLYAFAANSPLNYIDPDGRDIIRINGGVKFTGEDAKKAFRAIKAAERSRKKEKKKGGPFIHFVYESITPHIYRHTRNAFRKGKTNYLHYDSNRTRQRKRRRWATKYYPSRASEGLQRDEYPYASTYEGGEGALVTYVPSKENSSQGGSLGALYSQMSDGDGFLVLPVPTDTDPEPVDVPVTTPSDVPVPVIPPIYKPVKVKVPKPGASILNLFNRILNIPFLLAPPGFEYNFDHINTLPPTGLKG